MTEVWNVTAAYDKASYVQGEQMRVTISGDFVRDVLQHGVAGPLSIPVISVPSGTTGVVNVGTVDVSWTEQVHENVMVDPNGTVVDGSGRTWVIVDGLHIAATA